MHASPIQAGQAFSGSRLYCTTIMQALRVKQESGEHIYPQPCSISQDLYKKQRSASSKASNPMLRVLQEASKQFPTLPRFRQQRTDTHLIYPTSH